MIGGQLYWQSGTHVGVNGGVWDGFLHPKLWGSDFSIQQAASGNCLLGYGALALACT